MADASVDGDLESQLGSFMDEMEDSVEGKIKGIAKLFFTYQSDDTVGVVPVDTGRYKHSWRASVNEPDTSHEDINDNGPFPTPNFTLQGNFEIGDSIHITNSVPYAKGLNQGRVQQVPDHFFETNFESALNIPVGTIPREDN